MGFLHKLWDETLAGPAPETGLGKLRKYDSFSATRSRSLDHHRDNQPDITITRSITILRRNSSLRNLSVDQPDSPSGSNTPRTPLTPGTPAGDFKRFTRRKFPTEDGTERAEPRSPTVYDWVVISALDC